MDGDPISGEMNPSGPQISEKGANISTINCPLIGTPGSTPSDTLFPMYFHSLIDDRKLIGV